jgi:hypothetical protein
MPAQCSNSVRALTATSLALATFALTAPLAHAQSAGCSTPVSYTHLRAHET